MEYWDNPQPCAECVKLKEVLRKILASAEQLYGDGYDIEDMAREALGKDAVIDYNKLPWAKGH